MNEKIKLSECVMLIDAAFLNFAVKDIKGYFERSLNRPLQEIDLSLLTTYLALDAGITEGDNKIQLLFIYDKESAKLAHCKPADLKRELDGVAFSSSFGELVLLRVCRARRWFHGELFIDLLGIVADASDVKKLIVLSYNEEYGESVSSVLSEIKGKEIIQFRMIEPDGRPAYHWEMLAFPVMQALGIKADEL